MTDERFQKKLEKIKKRGERYKQEKELRDTYAEYLPEHKKRRVSNIMLVIVIFAVVAYAVADFILQYHMGIEMSSTLTTCWYTFFGAEIFALAGIKVSKVWRSSNDNSCG